MIESTPTTNNYFEDNDISKIKVPTHIGGSYSTDIHTSESLRASEEIRHQDKWQITSHFHLAARLVETDL